MIYLEVDEDFVTYFVLETITQFTWVGVVFKSPSMVFWEPYTSESPVSNSELNIYLFIIKVICDGFCPIPYDECFISW